MARELNPGQCEPHVIGLTGPIASGKSTVAALLRERGAEVIDADLVYRSMLVPGSPLVHEIAQRFGPGIMSQEGEIDRAALAEIVFSEPSALADLESISHPLVVAEIRRRAARSSAPILVIEAIKLVEAGLTDTVDQLWYVTADSDVRLRRLINLRGLTEQDARARLGAASENLSARFQADVIIDNSGDPAALKQAVGRAWVAAGVDATRKRQACAEIRGGVT